MSYLILILLLTVVPFVCGLLPMSLLEKEKHTFLGTYMLGWFTQFALFEIIAVPLIVKRCSFGLLVTVFSCVLAVFMVASMILGRKVFANSVGGFRSAVKNLSTAEKIVWMVVVVLLAVQMIYLSGHQYLDGDDAYYVTMANDTINSDTMYRTMVYQGYPAPIVEIRHALAPVPVFMAWVARLTEIHPTILAHTYIGPFFVALMYGGYVLLGRRLFRKDRKWVCGFTLAVMISYVFGHVSLYTAETFAYTRTWQGKSMLPNLIIPALFLAIIELYDRAELGEWIRVWIVMIASFFTTSVAVVFTGVFIGIAGIILLIKSHNKKNIINLGISMALCVAVGIIYLRG